MYANCTVKTQMIINHTQRILRKQGFFYREICYSGTVTFYNKVLIFYTFLIFFNHTIFKNLNYLLNKKN